MDELAMTDEINTNPVRVIFRIEDAVTGELLLEQKKIDIDRRNPSAEEVALVDKWETEGMDKGDISRLKWANIKSANGQFILAASNMIGMEISKVISGPPPAFE